MELLSNGNPSKRHMENGHRLKYKPRKVSAVRDFPPGCGSNAVLVVADKDSVNRVQKELEDSLDNLVAKVVAHAKSACDVEIELPKGLENNDVDVLKNTNEIELPKGLENNDVDVLKDTNEIEGKGLAENKAVLGGHVFVRVESGSVKKYKLRRISATREFPPFCGRNAPLPTEEDRFRICGKKTLVVGEKGGDGIGVLGETLRACEEGGKLRGEARVGGGDESKEIALESNKKTPLDDENVKKSESKEAVPESRKRIRVEEGNAHKSDSKKIVPEPRKKINVRDGDVQMSESKESACEPRKKAHARDGNLQKNELKEIGPVIEPRKKAHAQDGDLQKCESKEVMSVPETKKKFHDPDRNEQKSESKEKRDTMERKSNKDVRAPMGKVGKEIVVYSSDKDVRKEKQVVVYTPDKDFRKEKQVVVYSADKNVRKPSGDAVGLEQELVIVQCLMAAPNCPWKQGRGTVSSPNVSSSRRKVKKSDSDGQEKSRLRTSMNNYEANNSVGKKSRSAGKAAYGGVNDLVVRDEEDEAAHTEDQNEDSPAGQRPSEFSVSLPPFGPNSSNQGDARNKVRETLRLFQAICRKLLQGEESKSRQVEESKSNKHLRIDLVAARIVRDKGKELNNGKQILGSVPGVEVGDEFQYRVELAIVGIHRLYQAGIDYVKQDKEIVAASIVASGGYNDELDSADVLIYSGQGGNAVGKDKKAEDQKLERGNLALKNSIAAKNPVRVIRGSKETKASDSSDGKAKVILTTYVYDGLYMVEKYWQEMGVHGKLVFKFELRRIPGQPELAWKELKKSRKFKTREGLCVIDISGGKELFPICAVNTINDEVPPPFDYITKMIFPDQYLPVLPEGCNCSGVCTDSHRCSCAVKNGGEIPYNYNGAIVEAKPLVYECGPSCKCPSSCHNRVSQHGIKIQLEIFKTEARGWGVRSLNSISSGSFICEYIGELLEDKEAEQRTGNDEYLFDIGQNYNDCSLNVQSSSSEVVEDGGFTIDAAQFGNVGRFINHSCSPNLYAQNVLYDNEDKRIPHIMFFAAENIPPLQELTYHYNYTVDQVRDSNGNIRMKNCYCGSTECTGRMY